ncbi:MAG: ribonuclease E, partial [bacterium]|nr:ribonuclease E [bacterium]
DRPDFVNNIRLYQGELPLFNRYQIESQIESAFQREVRLPSGGSVVIDPTEALISIDINSAKATKGSDIEDTARNTNVEAAQEIARQLRLRDIGGLIVIDFIDMHHSRNQREVENVLREALKTDRARIQVGRISRFGLLEMSRQRLRPSLAEYSNIVCPRCDGVGNIRNIESLALSILRLIEDESMKDSTGQIECILPVEVATFLLNEKRKTIQQLEKRQNTRVIVVPNPYMETPHYEVRRLRAGEENEQVSYSMAQQPEFDSRIKSEPEMVKTSADVPAVSLVAPATQPPVVAKKPETKKVINEEKKPGFIAKILHALFGIGKKPVETRKPQRRPQNQQNRGRNTRYKGKNTNRNAQNRNQQNRNQNRNQQNRNKPNQNRGQQNRNQQNQNQENQSGNQQNRTRKPVPVAQQDTAENKVQQQNNRQTQPKKPRPQRKPRSQRRTTKASDTQDSSIETKSVTRSQTEATAQKEAGSSATTEVKTNADNKPVKKTSRHPTRRRTRKPATDKKTADNKSSFEPAVKQTTEAPEQKQTKENKPVKARAESVKAEQQKPEQAQSVKPKAEKPSSDKPKAEKPKAKKPADEKPITDKPKAKKPKVKATASVSAATTAPVSAPASAPAAAPKPAPKPVAKKPAPKATRKPKKAETGTLDAKPTP